MKKLQKDQVSFPTNVINNTVNAIISIYHNNNLISVFTTTYHSGEKILRPYQSLLDQKYINWEWIIIDDSKDMETYNALKHEYQLAKDKADTFLMSSVTWHLLCYSMQAREDRRDSGGQIFPVQVDFSSETSFDFCLLITMHIFFSV